MAAENPADHPRPMGRGRGFNEAAAHGRGKLRRMSDWRSAAIALQ